jgi:transcriptional regulator with XRE-family HTH domain
MRFSMNDKSVLQSRAMSLTSIVAQNLLAARKQRNISQQAVAKKAGLSVSYVSMLERGERTPPLETLEVLANALGVRPLDLLQVDARGRSRASR